MDRETDGTYLSENERTPVETHELAGRAQRRESRRLTSDAYFNLVMPELATLRRELNSRDNSIDNLKRSLTTLESKNYDLSHNLKKKIGEIKFLGEKLHIAEAAALDAVRDVCKEREQAEKVASDFRQRFQVSQTKLKREIDKYHKLHKSWEAGKVNWANEKKLMQQNQRNAGIKLLAVLEEFLDAQQTQEKQNPEPSAEISKLPIGEEGQTLVKIITNTASHADVNTGGINEDQNEKAELASVGTGTHKSSRSNAANTSVKRLSLHENSDTVPSVPTRSRGTDVAQVKSKLDSGQEQENLRGGAEEYKEKRGRPRDRESLNHSSSRTTIHKTSEKEESLRTEELSVSEYMDTTSAAIPSLRSRSQKPLARGRGAKRTRRKSQSKPRSGSQITLDRAYVDNCLGIYAAGMTNASLQGRSKRPRTPRGTRPLRTPYTPNSGSASIITQSKAGSPSKGLFIPPRGSSANFHQQKFSRSRGNVYSARDSYSTQQSYVYGSRHGPHQEDIPPVPDIAEWKYKSKNSPYARAETTLTETTPVQRQKFKRLRKLLNIFSKQHTGTAPTV